MQDPAAVSAYQMNPQFTEQEQQLKCPRCESTNTKFCYYNNYNLSQPRHFCKNCRRYWTKGGSLRNIPVGGGTRKNNNSKPRAANPTKRAAASLPSPSSSASSSSPAANPAAKPDSPAVYGLHGSFSSLLSSNLFEGLGSHGETAVQLGNFGEESANLESNLIRNHHPEMVKLQSENNGGGENTGFLGLQSGEDSSCWGGGNGWPHDLAIYTPGSNFQ